MGKAKAFLESQKYVTSITAKNIEVTKPIHSYIEEKIAKIEKLTTQIMEIDVRLDIQKLSHLVDIVIKFSHFKIKVHAQTDDMYSAIDKAFERLFVKVRKWKSRIQDHHAKGVSVTEMEVNVLEHAEEELEEINQKIATQNNREIEKTYELPKVVKTKKRALKTLVLDEAVMKMELSNDHFLLYRSEEEQKLKVMYRRRDGSYGIITAEE